ncbi:class I SAM-dependent methyltransferase [Kitasatospora viridis]|uniref:Methyltransferase family protein n=1 Tax=Kitasatospora viridis TaxID=281105 RepID=A0A561UQE3_9ACTN|nr:class I SAM-dependent methyltransferase [Kitasatospora viridis]TWG01593.1 methyltransferase family protein [Kitasatospora viridis]
MTSVPRSLVFGEVAELYDRARPGYLPELYAAVLDYAALDGAALDGAAALEIGAGTGKATVGLADRGVPLVALEPDARMAQVLRRNTERWPQVEVEVGPFEEFQPGERQFGLLFAATCWHWVDPDRRWELARRVLRPGGAVALCWNPQGILDPQVFARLDAVARRYGMGDVLFEPAATFDEAPQDREDWPLAECQLAGGFTDPRSLRFSARAYWTTEEYVGLQASISAYRILPEDVRERALGEVAEVLDANGGGVEVLQVNDLFLARRSAATEI